MKLIPSLRPLFLGATILSLPLHAADLNLLESYRLAVEHDPELAAARAQRRADQEKLPQARAQFLPQAALEADRSRVNIDQEGGTASDSSFDSGTIAVGVRQPLFRMEAFAQLRQARAALDFADLRYEIARQQLVLQTAGAYFRVLNAEDAVATFDAEMRAIESQLNRAKRAFELGAGTVTDVNEAQARLDATRARRISALNERRLARENLRRLVGRPPGELAGLPQEFEPQAPQPLDANAWSRLAEEDNLRVRLARASLELARGQEAQARAARYPQVDLVARYSDGYQDPQFSARIDSSQKSIGIQLRMPLYTGGAISAQVREAGHQQEVSYQQLLSSRREAALTAESAFLTLTANIEQIRALEQALVSIASTEESTRRGLELGLRTTLDLLNVQRERFEIELNLARTRYNYLLNYLQLQAAVGEPLNEDVIARVNAFLAGSTD